MIEVYWLSIWSVMAHLPALLSSRAPWLVDFEIRNISIVFLFLERDENLPGTDLYFLGIPYVGYWYLHEKNSQHATRRHTRTHNHKQLIICSSRDRFVVEYDDFFVRQATSGRTHRSVACNADAITPPDCYPCQRCSLSTYLGCWKDDTNWL